MDSPKTTPSTQSPLLKLPGEVRNQIYALVLSTSPRHHINFTRASEDRRINQLQLTSRQLYEETRLLELKFNPVKINGHAIRSKENLLDDKDPTKAKRVFLNLTRLLGPERLPWITSLTLFNQVPIEDGAYLLELKEMASTMLHLTDVLRSNPALRVKYNMHEFCKASLLRGKEDDKLLDLMIILRGISVSSVVRDETLEHMWPTAAPVSMRIAQAFTMSYAEQYPVFQALRQAPLETKELWDRIRFFPNPDVVTAQSFVLSPNSSVCVQSMHAQGSLQLWATLFRRWMEEGI